MDFQRRRAAVRFGLILRALVLAVFLPLCGSGCSKKSSHASPPAGPGNSGGPPPQVGIPRTATSITLNLGPGRSDPEGVAPPATLIRNLIWKDSRGSDRILGLNAYLYRYDFSFDDGSGGPEVHRTANDDAFGHPGFGYVVSHNTANGNSPLGKANTPSAINSWVLAGGHHAFHRVDMIYNRDLEGGDASGRGIKIPVVIEWLVATGRDHPVWAVTWRMGSATNPHNIDFTNDYRMDTRGPYGSLNFDGAPDRAQGDAIGGVAWGDAALKFTTTDAQLTLNSPWTYNTPNAVDFTRAWTETVNAEMGIVQTRPGDTQMGYPDRVVGRERGSRSDLNFLNKGDCSGAGDNRKYLMPCINGWPYQLMNFDWDPSSGKDPNEATGTKLMAWGTPYGWLGASSFKDFFGADAVGSGDRSYATFIVLGPKCRQSGPGTPCDQEGDVALVIREVEALAAATITNVGPGALVTQLPRGPGATDTKVLANGYNDTFAAYYLDLSANSAGFTFTPAAGRPVKNPIFVLRGWTETSKVPAITVNGAPITVNSGTFGTGAFVSIDDTPHDLWVTLNATVSAPTDITIAVP